MATRGNKGQPDDREQPEEEHASLFAAIPLSEQVAFWRKELPRFGREYNLRTLHEPVTLCPICGGQQTYRPENSTREIPCFCQLQAHYQQKVAQWREYNFLPRRYQQLERGDILLIERSFTPTQRAQFAVALKAIDRFIENPQGNLILVGAVGTGRSTLAAYIARQLEPVPGIFITLRQLVDLLGKAEANGAAHVRELFYNIPVLIVDDFSATYTELDSAAAQQLYDLVYHRWSEMLPIVLTSNVELGRLDALYGPLLDYLQQDAEVYTFDRKQVQVSRATTARTAGRATPPVPVQVHRCPWLGAADGSGSFSVFPTPSNYCLRTVTPQPITLAHQASACLSGEHGACPVFQTAEGQPVEALPGDILRRERTRVRREQPRWGRLISLLAVVGIVSGLLVWGGILFSEPIKNFVLGVTPQPTLALTPSVRAPLILPPTSTPVLPTATPTPEPPTATPTLTPTTTATPLYVAQVTLASDTNLRQGPSIEAPIIKRLPAGTRLNVLGRDGFGIWLRVETANGLSGWVAVTQIAEEIDVLTLPIYVEPTPAPEASVSGTGDYQQEASASLTPTPTASIPNTFNILLQATNISSCDYPDLSLDYAFRLGENSITISRLLDGTVLGGSYEPLTGIFRVSATHDFGVEEMDGNIRLNGGWIEVSGEQRLTYFDGSCNVVWSISGRIYPGVGE